MSIREEHNHRFYTQTLWMHLNTDFVLDLAYLEWQAWVSYRTSSCYLTCIGSSLCKFWEGSVYLSAPNDKLDNGYVQLWWRYSAQSLHSNRLSNVFSTTLFYRYIRLDLDQHLFELIKCNKCSLLREFYSPFFFYPVF